MTNDGEQIKLDTLGKIGYINAELNTQRARAVRQRDVFNLLCAIELQILLLDENGDRRFQSYMLHIEFFSAKRP